MMNCGHNEDIKFTDKTGRFRPLTVDDIFNTSDIDDFSDISDDELENERIPVSFVEDEIINEHHLETINEDDLLDELMKKFEKDFPESTLHSSESVSGNTTQSLEKPSTCHVTTSFSAVSSFSEVFTAKEVKKPRRITHGKIKDLKWKKKFLPAKDNEVKFTGNLTVPDDIKNLKTPYEFFCYFFPDSLIDHIVEQTNLYSLQQDISKSINVTKNEIRRYIGILVMSSTVTCKNFRYYWNASIGNNIIMNAMTLNRFESICSFIHYNDNNLMLPYTHQDYDKLFKIRPIIETVRRQFLSIPLSENLSIDEQMCASKFRHHLRIYMPDKPHKWGFKLFILCGSSGFCYDFEIYSGKETELMTGEEDLGASSNVVVRLARSIPSNCAHKLFFDNYYTSIPLMIYLNTRKIYSCGTARRNRIVNCPLLPDNDASKQICGYSEEYVSSYNNTNFNVVSWKDNKCVMLMSTFLSSQETVPIKRYNCKTKQKETITCPNIVTQYNKHMGGVDHLDSMIGRYRIQMKIKKKWYQRLMHHLIDLVVINAWHAHRMTETDNKMNILDFRINLGTTLCCLGEVTPQATRGQPSRVIDLPVKRKIIKSSVPTSDVRLDQKSHWPQKGTKRICKLPSCSGTSRIECSKCKVPLCLTNNKNCFYKYHNE